MVSIVLQFSLCKSRPGSWEKQSNCEREGGKLHFMDPRQQCVCWKQDNFIAGQKNLFMSDVQEHPSWPQGSEPYCTWLKETRKQACNPDRSDPVWKTAQLTKQLSQNHLCFSLPMQNYGAEVHVCAFILYTESASTPCCASPERLVAVRPRTLRQRCSSSCPSQP